MMSSDESDKLGRVRDIDGDAINGLVANAGRTLAKADAVLADVQSGQYQATVQFPGASALVKGLVGDHLIVTLAKKVSQA